MRSSKLLSALPLALLLLAAAPAFADAQQHVGAAKRAEHHGDWSKALSEWKAAYSQDVNAEYLIGIGDAYAKLGNKEEAKKNYDAYLSDPLALPANVARVKGKMASLDAGPGLDLPGSGGGLALPAAAPSGLSLPADPGGPSLDFPPAPAETGRKGRKGRKGAEPAQLPGLDLPGSPPQQAARPASDPGLGLPGLDLPAPKKPAEKKIASASPGLDLPPMPGLPEKKAEKSPGLGLDLPPLPGSEQPKAAVAINAQPARTPTAAHETRKPLQVATASPTNAVHTSTVQPAAVVERKHEPAPIAALAELPAARESPSASSGSGHAIAFVTAGVALVALGGGAYAYTKASSAHSDLTGSIHDGATAQGLLETEKRNKTISFIGLAGGLVAAGIATALFAF
jgi:hypothetical protein